MMTLATMTAATAALINDSQQTRQAGNYTQALNLAQQQFAFDTKCLWKDYTIAAITPGTATYALPSDFMWEKRVLYNGVPLGPASRDELARTHAGSRWDIITGTPTTYTVDPEVAKSSMTLFPIPDSNDNKDLILTYFCYPTDMASGGCDNPLNATPLLAPFHIGICAWAGWYLLASEDADGKMEANRRELIEIYNKTVTEAVNTFKNTVSQPLRMRGVRYCPVSR